MKTKLVAVFLCLSLIPAPRAQEKLPALIIGGFFVLIVGSVIGCRTVQKCRRIAAARTNSWPAESPFAPAGATYGAYFSNPQEGECYAWRLGTEPTTVRLDISILSDGTASVTNIARLGWQESQSFWEAQAEAAEYGIEIPDSFEQVDCYSINRQPCSAEDSPVRFNRDTSTITVGGGVIVTVERSRNLVSWENVMRLNVARGVTIQADDCSMDGSGFYRVTTSKP